MTKLYIYIILLILILIIFGIIYKEKLINIYEWVLISIGSFLLIFGFLWYKNNRKIEINCNGGIELLTYINKINKNK
jgi:hypothetical protein